MDTEVTNQPQNVRVQDLDPIDPPYSPDTSKKDPSKKKKNTTFNLSLSNTVHRNNIKCPGLTDSFEQGGWVCNNCKILIAHDDLVGTPESNGFNVMGYNCHNCGHRWLREKYAETEIRCGQSFMTFGKWEIKRASTNDTTAKG